MELKIYSPNDGEFPSEIKWNFEEIKAWVSKSLQDYKGVVYSEDQIKEAKADLAKLRKANTAIDTERKRIKAVCMKPYTEFEGQVKEVTGIIQEAVDAIDSQVKGFEEKQKKEKADNLELYWSGIKADKEIPEEITLKMIWNPKWLNKTISEEKAKEEILARVDGINSDLKTLKELPKYGFEAVQEYLKTLDINQAIVSAKRMVEIQEAKRKAQEEAQAKAAEAAKCTPENLYEEFNKPVEPTPKSLIESVNAGEAVNREDLEKPQEGKTPTGERVATICFEVTAKASDFDRINKLLTEIQSIATVFRFIKK